MARIEAMTVLILSRQEAENGGAAGADAVISIRGHGEAQATLDAALAQATGRESARLLRLHFDDIGSVGSRGRSAPAMEDLDAAIGFGRRLRSGEDWFDGPAPAALTIAVQSEHGLGRAPAIAAVLLADHLGPDREGEAVNAILRADSEGRMRPNPLVISLGDTALFRYGRIDAALAERCAAYRLRRERWRAARWDRG